MQPSCVHGAAAAPNSYARCRQRPPPCPASARHPHRPLAWRACGAAPARPAGARARWHPPAAGAPWRGWPRAGCTAGAGQGCHCEAASRQRACGSGLCWPQKTRGWAALGACGSCPAALHMRSQAASGSRPSTAATNPLRRLAATRAAGPVRSPATWRVFHANVQAALVQKRVVVWEAAKVEHGGRRARQCIANAWQLASATGWPPPGAWAATARSWPTPSPVPHTG